jgi:hypothetical protein
MRASQMECGTSRLVALVLLAGLGGCAAKVRPAVTAQQRSQLGRVRVVVDDAQPALSVSAPTPLGSVGGATVGATKGFGLGVLGGAACYATLGQFVPGCIYAVATPYLVVEGGYQGAKGAVAAGERSENFERIVAALKETQQQRLASVIEREKAGRPAVAADPSIPASDVETVAEVTLLRVALDEAPDCASYGCTEKPAAKFLDVAPSVDPMLGLLVEARVRLVDRADERTMFETTYLHRSDKAEKFTQWGREGGAEIRAARDDVFDTLGRCIALDVFGPAASEPSRDLYKTTCKDER